MAEVRYPLPWNWEGLDKDALAVSWRRLSTWVSWFVTRYHLAGRVPACWWRHPELGDELRALWYYHQEVTAPMVEMFQPDPVGLPQEPEEPSVPARAHWEWHEARWRWTTGALREALGYRECVAKGQHVEDHPHEDDAAAFAEATRLGLDQAADAGELR